MHALFAAALTVLYPHRCLGCGVYDTLHMHFCTTCKRFLRRVQAPLCTSCGLPFAANVGPDHLCVRCRTRRPAFRKARAWALYHTGGTTPQPLSEAIQHFKYQRRLSTGRALADLAAAFFPFGEERYDLAVPVPLHLDRLRWRGFNQSLLLAQAIGHARQIPVDPFLLERIRPTVPQTQLDENERSANVRGAFAVQNTERLKEKTVLLIDDVYTSGSTVNECARMLRRAGAAAVDVFTLARAVPH